MTAEFDTNGRMRQLLAIMARLRAADGCPWDREQSFASIAPYTIEEAYEVADAVERGDMPHLKDELGDLLFQVVFHAQIASEAKHFDFEAVAGAICDKLLRRHPHVFGAGASLTPAEQSIAWEEIKAQERGAAGVRTGHLDGVPRTLPALMRAFKLSKRAARVGFDFEHAGQTADKVAEELAEVREASAACSPQVPARRRVLLRRSSRRSAICCSRPPIWPANSMSMPRRHCVPRTPSSSGAFAAWNPWRRSAARYSRS